jgi:pimeloyl-ACP methyl ester carboxylesterase
VHEFSQEDLEAPLARGEFPQVFDGPSDPRELFFPPFFPPLGGCSSQATGDFPRDFKVPSDQGGPPHCFPRVPIGGFGGDRNKDRSGHRAVVQRVGKAPIILIHGHTGLANSGRWAMFDQGDPERIGNTLIREAGYTKELVWAPSYLGTAAAILGGGGGGFDIVTPHTNNVNEVRDFIDRVCEYLGVEVVDIIAHSLGCTLAYSVFRGLKQGSPLEFNQPKKWNRVGTFVALAGAFRGLTRGSGEWVPGDAFMTELLSETDGGGGETPFGQGGQQTPGPVPHPITYYCGIAKGDFVDSQSPDQDRSTSMLEGAIHEVFKYTGDDLSRHEQIITDRDVVMGNAAKGLEGFSRHLNSVPPVPRVTMMVAMDSGDHDGPLMSTIEVDSPDKVVNYVANKVTKEVLNDYVVSKSTEILKGTFIGGRSKLTLPDGMWEVVYNVEGAAEDVKRTYWVGATEMIEVTIDTDNSTPFEGSLDVTATATRGKLYHSLYGSGQSAIAPIGNELRAVVCGGGWREGDVARIDEDAVVYFIAIDSDGIASEIVSRSFARR